MSAERLYRGEVLDRFPRGSVGAMIDPWDLSWLKAVLYEVEPRVLYMVSAWSAPVDPTFEDAHQLINMRAVARMAAPYALDGRVRIVCADPLDVGASVPNEALDWLDLGIDFISPDRLYPTLSLWGGKVKEGGYVIGRGNERMGRYVKGLERYQREAHIEEVHMTKGKGQSFWFVKGGADGAT